MVDEVRNPSPIILKKGYKKGSQIFSCEAKNSLRYSALQGLTLFFLKLIFSVCICKNVLTILRSLH